MDIQRAVLGEVLCARYPAAHEAILYDASTHPLEPPRIVLHRLDDLAEAPVNDVSTLYVPPASPAPVDQAMRARLSLGGAAVELSTSGRPTVSRGVEA